MDIVWTLDKIAYAIKNNLEAGLKGTNNYVFAIDQIRSAVIAKRNALVKELEQQGIVDYDDLAQEINCIELDCEDLAMCCDINTKQNVLHFKVPVANKILYVGTVNYQQPFKIYTDEGFRFNKYRNKLLIERPYVWLRQTLDATHGFIFNPPTFNLKYISVKGIFENPYELSKYSCCAISEDSKFPAPDYLIDSIIKSITNEYSIYFYRFNGMKPNDQSSTI